MRKLLFSICFLAIFLFSAYWQQANAQGDISDSIVSMIRNVKIGNNLDTVAFEQVRDLIQVSKLNDTQIEKIEAAASALNNGDNWELSFLIHQRIFESLIANDVNKAIDYGHKNLALINKSNTPEKVLHKDYFLTVMRIPYRNSSRIDEGIRFYNQLIVEAKAVNDSVILAQAYYVLGGFYNTVGLLDHSIYNFRKSLTYMDTLAPDNEVYWGVKKKINGKERWLNNSNVVAQEYIQTGQYQKAFAVLNDVANANPDIDARAVHAFRKIQALLGIDSLEEIPNLLEIAYQRQDDRAGIYRYHVYEAAVLQTEALYHIKIGDFSKAEAALNKCKELVLKYQIPPAPFSGTVAPDYYFALLRNKQKRYAEAVEYIKRDIERMTNLRKQLLIDYRLLAETYQSLGRGNEAAAAYQQYNLLHDAVLEEQAKFRRSSFEIEEEMNERELAITNLRNENRVSTITRNFIIGLAALLLFVAVFAYSRYRIKQKDNRLLANTLANLKATQSQLIQSEKMASLGELTAGIAHEIQNPLNFVNNFSDVNRELVDELQQELKAGKTDDAFSISENIKENEEKIIYHGKRADAIVKNMLLHSRGGSGTKEQTDINAMADEYLRLSFHGMRAREKSFNAKYETSFDNAIGKINIVQQEIGRVLLNLINNAFYAVNEKAKQNISGYNPTVTVSTKKLIGKVEISVKDNGKGIPDAIKEKIFQPFFTTKPTGSGTGLGLSLSYDIIKAHGGEIKVNTIENEGTEFVIQLPI